MPHASSPATGFQAFILCGPGESLNPFNSNPKDFPKALIPIANRPMVWYPLEWCHRMGISNIHLMTPPECAPALDAALSQNPYLTSLPSPKPTLLSPDDLTRTTGTAEIFSLPQVQEAVTGDFLVLPCDLVCELPGSSLLETWMTLQGSLSGTNDLSVPAPGRRGALAVWYDTKDGGEDGVGVKKEETDFLATTDVPPISAVPPPTGSLRPYVRNVALTMPTDTLKDKIDEDKALLIRESLLRKHGRVKLHMKHRDAHIYFLPYWCKEYMRRNDTFESLGEDVLGWWAKAGWQSGLSQKLQIDEAMRPTKRRKSDLASTAETAGIDIAQLSSTCVREIHLDDDTSTQLPTFASRVGTREDDARGSSAPNTPSKQPKAHKVPPLIGYLHPSHYTPPSTLTANPSQKQQKPQQKPQQNSDAHPDATPPLLPSPLIRRIDTVPLLLSCSLYLARLPTLLQPASNSAAPIYTSTSTHPYLHPQAIHPSTTIPPTSTIDTRTVLIDANVTLQPRITLRSTVIGPNCSIASGSRLQNCLLMEGAVVEEKAVLSGCVLGRRCKVGKGAELRDCFVQEGYVVAEGTSAKGEVLAGFGGVEEDEEDDGGEGLDLMA